jgi:hypothetical protein
MEFRLKSFCWIWAKLRNHFGADLFMEIVMNCILQAGRHKYIQLYGTIS